MRRYSECVVNLPTPEMWQKVEKLAPLTGKDPVPEIKAKQFRFEPHKFETAELTPIRSEVVQPMRAKECPIHLEAKVTKMHALNGEKLRSIGVGVAAEIEILRVQCRRRFRGGRQLY